MEEVLQSQPEPIRRFLLRTAILDRLNGSLCDTVTGEEKGNARLQALQRGTFFVIPLDDKRNWYRYHHLFADVLRMHLMAEQPDQVPALHRRASEWYEQNGLRSDAIRHALAAEDFERAAKPIELVRVRPVLSAWSFNQCWLVSTRQGDTTSPPNNVRAFSVTEFNTC